MARRRPLRELGVKDRAILFGFKGPRNPRKPAESSLRYSRRLYELQRQPFRLMLELTVDRELVDYVSKRLGIESGKVSEIAKKRVDFSRKGEMSAQILVEALGRHLKEGVLESYSKALGTLINAQREWVGRAETIEARRLVERVHSRFRSNPKLNDLIETMEFFLGEPLFS